MALLFLVLTGGIFLWEYQSIQTLKSKEMILRGEMQSWVKKGKQMTTFYSVLDEAKRVSQLLTKGYFFPSEEEQIRLITTLEQLAQTFALKAEVRSLELAPDYAHVSGVIACSGAASAVIEYMRTLEVFPHRLIIDEVSLQSKGVQSIQSTQSVEAILTFRIIDIQKPLTP